MNTEEIINELRETVLDMRKGIHTPAHIATIMRTISYIKSMENERAK